MNKDDVFQLRIKDILKEKGMTAKELAEKMGKAPQYINSILNGGKGTSVNTLVDIAIALDVEFRDLFAPTRSELTCPHCGKPICIEIKK